MSGEYEGYASLAEWIASRPESVRKLAAEFPLDMVIVMGGERLFLLGYTEQDRLIFSRVDPAADYEGAVGSKVYIFASHVREAMGRG